MKFTEKYYLWRLSCALFDIRSGDNVIVVESWPCHKTSPSGPESDTLKVKVSRSEGVDRSYFGC